MEIGDSRQQPECDIKAAHTMWGIDVTAQADECGPMAADCAYADGGYFRGPASDHPAYPIRMSARDLARFALLYLHDGRWRDHQIVPAAWVRDRVRAYSAAFPELGPGFGYGCLWWIGFPSDMGASTVKVPAGTFEAIGAEGQYAFVIPAYDLVIVHRINSDPPLAPLGPRKPEPTFRQIGLRQSGTWRIDDHARYCRTLNDRDGNPGADTSHERCFDVVVKNRTFQFFDADGLMQFDTQMK